MTNPPTSSQSDDDGEIQAIKAFREANERAAKAALDKKKAVLNKVKTLADEYKANSESSVNKHMNHLKSSVKEHRAGEKLLLAEIESTKKELLDLIQQKEKYQNTLAEETMVTEGKISKQIKILSSKQLEIHEQEGKALESGNDLLWDRSGGDAGGNNGSQDESGNEV